MLDIRYRCLSFLCDVRCLIRDLLWALVLPLAYVQAWPGVRGVQGGPQGAYDLGIVRYSDGHIQGLAEELVKTQVMGYTTSKDKALLDADATNHAGHAVNDGLVKAQRNPVAVFATGDERDDL